MFGALLAVPAASAGRCVDATGCRGCSRGAPLGCSNRVLPLMGSRWGHPPVESFGWWAVGCGTICECEGRNRHTGGTVACPVVLRTVRQWCALAAYWSAHVDGW